MNWVLCVMTGIKCFHLGRTPKKSQKYPRPDRNPHSFDPDTLTVAFLLVLNAPLETGTYNIMMTVSKNKNNTVVLSSRAELSHFTRSSATLKERLASTKV